MYATIITFVAAIAVMAVLVVLKVIEIRRGESRSVLYTFRDKTDAVIHGIWRRLMRLARRTRHYSYQIISGILRHAPRVIVAVAAAIALASRTVYIGVRERVSAYRRSISVRARARHERQGRQIVDLL